MYLATRSGDTEMKNKKFIFVNNEWWKVFDVEDFTKPEEDAGLGERLFYTKLKQHSVLCVDKHGNWNHWVYKGSEFTVIANSWPEWIPVDREQVS